MPIGEAAQTERCAMHTYETNGKMKMKKLMRILTILVSTFVTFCVGCETSNVKEVQALQFVRDELSNKVLALTRENAELSQKVKALEKEVEVLKNEPGSVFARAYDENEEERYDSALRLLETLRQEYPDLQPDRVASSLKEYAQAKVECEKRQHEYAASSSGELEVTISIRPEFEPDGRVRIWGETNLPLGTELWINIKEKSGSRTIGQARCSVTDGGRFRSEPLGGANGFCRGVYVADVLMPGVRLQPHSVQLVVGANGERLAGPLVTRDALGITVRSSPCEFTFAGDSTAVAQGQMGGASQKAADPKAHESTSKHKSIWPMRYVYYKPGTTLAQAVRDRDTIMTTTFSNTPMYKLTTPGYWDMLFEIEFEKLGYIGVNSPFLPEGYITEDLNRAHPMAGLP
ncbi:hypothetical protein [Anaerobaca lacustris]|uniref:Uncharacterized protein n=1 Tax=Anaerobaca lacustris TaxID=3044600 RepID=A0AAW6TZ24_9BACT|nr:hypothetical protein [Sedimentisphaerales bacterium M17dextr]